MDDSRTREYVLIISASAVSGIIPGDTGLSEKNLSPAFRYPLNFDPSWRAADRLFNVCSAVCSADRYLVNQRVSCPWSNSRRRFAPPARLHVTRVSRASRPPSPFSPRSTHLSASLFISFADTQSRIHWPIGIYRACWRVHACKPPRDRARFRSMKLAKAVLLRKLFPLHSVAKTDRYYRQVALFI